MRIGQELELIQNKSRNNQGPAKKARRAQISDTPVNDDVRVNHERLVLSRFAGEAHIRDDEREFVTTAAHREHHAEITENRVNDQPDLPLGCFRLIA